MERQNPKVGIFWFLEGRLLYDHLPLDRAESFGASIGYPGAHESVWEFWRQHARIPVDLEYDDPPRGRVNYDLLKEHFLLMADNCILRLPEVVATIMGVFALPTDRTEKLLDLHYRCKRCLKGHVE